MRPCLHARINQVLKIKKHYRFYDAIIKSLLMLFLRIYVHSV